MKKTLFAALVLVGLTGCEAPLSPGQLAIVAKACQDAGLGIDMRGHVVRCWKDK